MSRLPCSGSNDGVEPKVYAVTMIAEDFPVTSGMIAHETRKDVVLGRVLEYTLNGWPEICPSLDFQPYHLRRCQLSVEQGCVLWGMRVLIPLCFRRQILNELHFEHPGIYAMKALARSFVLWPKLDGEIE